MAFGLELRYLPKNYYKDRVTYREPLDEHLSSRPRIFWFQLSDSAEDTGKRHLKKVVILAVNLLIFP